MINLKGIKIFRGLTENDFTILQENLFFYQREYFKGDLLIVQGDVINSIGMLLKGNVIGEKYHFDGHTQILFYYA